jgi:chemotaxis protein MotB
LPIDRLGSQVEVIKSESSVRFRISSELLFAPGEAGLTTEGLRLLDTLLPTFNLAIDRHIVVEGHTDDTPISTARFPSNWELAAGRAGSVVRHLQSRGLNPTRLRATGYAETRPIESNRTPQGQRANRRVELILELPRNDS